MQQYLDLLHEVLTRGRWKQQRAVLLSTTARPRALSLFGLQTRFDLTRGFPMVTTKRVPFRLVVEELLWFLSGSTSVKPLQAKGVTIWDEWADAAGDLGPCYGKQWRKWEAPDGRAIDQVAMLIGAIEAVRDNPEHSAARRLVLTAWNPADTEKLRGPMACHTLAQFDVTEGRLSCQLYQRSADLFLGVPWNIACYALLTHLLAKVTGLAVGEFVHTFGDAHLYENHIDAVRYQLTKVPYPPPRLVLDEAIATLEDATAERIKLEGYRHAPSLGGEVAV